MKKPPIEITPLSLQLKLLQWCLVFWGACHHRSRVRGRPIKILSLNLKLVLGLHMAHCSASTELISPEVRGDSQFWTTKYKQLSKKTAIQSYTWDGYLGCDPNEQRSVGTFSVSSVAADLDLCRDCKVHQRTSPQAKKKKKQHELTSLFTSSKSKIKHTWNGTFHAPLLKDGDNHSISVIWVTYHQPELKKCTVDNALPFPSTLDYISNHFFHSKNKRRALILTLQQLDTKFIASHCSPPIFLLFLLI